MYSRDRLIKAIDNSACLTRRQIDDYLQNKLFPEELYVVEMHLNECPFCNDAIEGFHQVQNANTLLARVEDFNFSPAAKHVTNSNKEVPKAVKQSVKESTIKEAKSIQKKEQSSQTQQSKTNNNPYMEEKKAKKFSMPMGIAAGVALALIVWGVYSISNNSKDKGELASQNATEMDYSSIEGGMTNERSINRRDDSIMNAKYGFQNQAPLSNTGNAVVRRYNSSNSGGTTNDSGGFSMADASAAAEPAVAKATTSDKSSSEFIGPKIPKEEEVPIAARKVSNAPAVAATTTEKARTATPVAKTEPTKRKTEETTVATKNKTATDTKATTTTKVDKDNKNTVAATTAAKPTNTKAAEKAETFTKKTTEENAAIAQAEKDYKKGLDLYNKKQYSASIMYFQSAAKVKAFANSKQAESYIKLAKSEVVNAERKKNSDK